MRDRAAELRLAFDSSFAVAPAGEPPPAEDLLAVTIGGDPYCFRLSEVAGLLVDRRIVPLPGRVAGFLGILSFRGTIVAGYGLRPLLGYPAEPPRWLVLASGPGALAFGFDQFDGHVRIPSSDLVPPDRSKNPAWRHVRRLARTREGVRAVLSLPSVVDDIARRVRGGGPST